MPGKLTLLLAAALFAAGCHHSAASESSELAKSLGRVTITLRTGDRVGLPVGRGFTIVNVFDDFSPGCPTGNRFDTIERLNSVRPAETTILLIFSDKNFSIQDVENFRQMLPMAESMVRGDIEALRPYLIDKKLLVVLDSNGRLVWQEKGNVSEQQLLSELLNLR
ncbi:MAG TPA: hypothetical protein VHS05_09425 [Pyrinomonadaceae bacterium]|jgi:hypothetical protein|nr:hypothetical protein [Pyrinomonadaceae bacterium]